MKNISFGIFTITVILFSSVKSNAQEPMPETFFPTTVGNKILYQNHNNPNPDFLVELYKDSVDAKGNKYVFFRSTLGGNLPSEGFKIDTNFDVYSVPIGQFDDTELWFKLKADTGDYWNIYESEEIKHIYQVLSKKYKTTVLGIPTTIMEIDWYSYSGDPSVLSIEDWKNKGLWAGRYALASGFGIVAAYGEPDEHVPVYAMKGAIINGDTLGNFDFVSSVENLEQNQSIVSCFPNPASDFTKVEFTLFSESSVTMTLYSVTGEKKLEFYYDKLPATHHFFPVSTSGYPAGVYYIRIASNTGTHITTLIITN